MQITKKRHARRYGLDWHGCNQAGSVTKFHKSSDDRGLEPAFFELIRCGIFLHVCAAADEVSAASPED